MSGFTFKIKINNKDTEGLTLEEYKSL
jgi:hypothetical protein